MVTGHRGDPSANRRLGSRSRTEAPAWDWGLANFLARRRVVATESSPAIGRREFVRGKRLVAERRLTRERTRAKRAVRNWATCSC
jgi:hypothetical protein